MGAPLASACRRAYLIRCMTDERLTAAMARIEQAVVRIERSSLSLPAADGEHERLRQRHALLRTRVEETVARLDALIAREGTA